MKLRRVKAEAQVLNIHQIPRLEKIVVNMGSERVAGESAIDDAAKDLAAITGRKPLPSASRARASGISSFRGKMPIGCRVTLRREAMYEFFDRLVAATLPRIRDFRGISPRRFDGRGNYVRHPGSDRVPGQAGKDQAPAGMDITIVTSAPTDDEAFDLLKLMGMPFSETGR